MHIKPNNNQLAPSAKPCSALCYPNLLQYGGARPALEVSGLLNLQLLRLRHSAHIVTSDTWPLVSLFVKSQDLVM